MIPPLRSLHSRLRYPTLVIASLVLCLSGCTEEVIRGQFTKTAEGCFDVPRVGKWPGPDRARFCQPPGAAFPIVDAVSGERGLMVAMSGVGHQTAEQWFWGDDLKVIGELSLARVQKTTTFSIGIGILFGLGLLLGFFAFVIVGLWNVMRRLQTAETANGTRDLSTAARPLATLDRSIPAAGASEDVTPAVTSETLRPPRALASVAPSRITDEEENQGSRRQAQVRAESGVTSADAPELNTACAYTDDDSKPTDEQHHGAAAPTVGELEASRTSEHQKDIGSEQADDEDDEDNDEDEEDQDDEDDEAEHEEDEDDKEGDEEVEEDEEDEDQDDDDQGEPRYGGYSDVEEDRDRMEQTEEEEEPDADDDSGSSLDIEACEDCDGEWLDHGNGDCSECHGSGFIGDPIEALSRSVAGQDQACENCGGSGKCPTCKGRGYVGGIFG